MLAVRIKRLWERLERLRDGGIPHSLNSYNPIPYPSPPSSLLPTETQFLVLCSAYDDEPLFEIATLFRKLLPALPQPLEEIRQAALDLMDMDLAKLYEEGSDMPSPREQANLVLSCDWPWKWPEPNDDVGIFRLCITKAGVNLVIHGTFPGLSKERHRELVSVHSHQCW